MTHSIRSHTTTQQGFEEQGPWHYMHALYGVPRLCLFLSLLSHEGLGI